MGAVGLGVSNPMMDGDGDWDRFDTTSRPEKADHATVGSNSGGVGRRPELLDGQAGLRAQLARLLAPETRLRESGQAGERDDADLAELRPIPDIVVMDLHNPTTVGVDALKRFSLDSAKVQILVVVADFGDNKPEAQSDHGRVRQPAGDITAPGLAARILGFGSPAQRSDLTRRAEVSKRELVVLAQVAAGLSNKQIGRLLGISQQTVRNHLSRIFGKLGAGNRTEAVMNAIRMGLLNP